jgi:hypothetical protein
MKNPNWNKQATMNAAWIEADHAVESSPCQITLTPAAPVSSLVPASSQEDIRDIRQPRHLPTPLPWAAAAAGVITLAAAAFALWNRIRRGKFLEMQRTRSLD